MLSLNVFSGFVNGLIGQPKRAPRKAVRTQIEHLENRALLSAVSLDVSPRELRQQEHAADQARKRAPNNNPNGATITITYPDLSIDVQAGDVVHLGTVTVRSNGKRDLYYSGSEVEGDNLDEIFANIRVENIKQVAVNDDAVNLTGFNALVRRKDTIEEFEIYGQARADLPAGTTIGTLRIKNGQIRYLKPKWPGFVHYSEGGQHIPQIHAHGAPIVNPTPAGVTVFPGDQTVEEGTTSSVGVVLNAQPASNVTLNFNLSSGPIGLSNSSVTFTPQNWNVPQYVTLNAPENAIDQPDQNQTLTVSVNDAASADNYDPLGDQVFTYWFSDNDPTVNPIAGDLTLNLSPTSINENGGSTTATVTLNSAHTGTVWVQLTSSTSAVPGDTILVFAPGVMTQSTVFTSADNNLDELDRQVTITASTLPTSDPRFVGIGKTAILTVIDDDNPVVTKGTINLTVTPSSAVEGNQFTAVVTLSSTAVGNVTVDLTNNGGLTGVTSLVFAPGEVSKTVMLTAPNDNVDEPDQSVTIWATATAGSDSEFSNVSDTENVTVIDDDPTVNPNPKGPEYSRFITKVGGVPTGARLTSFTFQTNVSTLTYARVAWDADGDGNVGSNPGEYFTTQISPVSNGMVTLSFAGIDVGAGWYDVQVRIEDLGIQNATFTPVDANVKDLNGNDLDVVFSPGVGGGPWFWETHID